VNTWESQIIRLNAHDLKQAGETLSLPDLAARLSEEIVKTVQSHKNEAWQLVKMDFNGGRVTLEFRRPSSGVTPS
jgi:hypothetical protein